MGGPEPWGLERALLGVRLCVRLGVPLCVPLCVPLGGVPWGYPGRPSALDLETADDENTGGELWSLSTPPPRLSIVHPRQALDPGQARSHVLS